MEMSDNTRDSPTAMNMNISRRSKKVKNLEQEVEFILSQDEDYEEDVPPPKTPSANIQGKDACTPLATEQSVLQDLLQTPRRSCRKSIKPVQDYQDIVVRKTLRSVSRSNKKELKTVSEAVNGEENVENLEEEHKWSAAKVGRSSSKRGRKQKRSKRNINEAKGDEGNVEDEKTRIEVKSGDDRKNVEEMVGENHMENANNLEIDTFENAMALAHIPSNNAKEIIDAVQDEGKVKETMPEELSETRESSTQNQVVVDEEHEQLEEEIHLIQEDSEDFKEEPIKTEKETFSKSQPIEEDAQDDSFGCYLKSKEINIEDLGLNPIVVDDEDEAEQDCKENTKKISHADEDMPSLIVVCDDEEDVQNEKGKIQVEKPKLNATFDAEDSVVLIIEEATSNTTSTTSENLEMEALKLSDDESEYSQGSSAKKAPRIMLTTTEDQNETLLTTPKQLAKPRSRVPTPYRSRSESKLKKETVGGSANKNLQMEDHVNLNMTTTSLTTMAPRDIVLRGIRKRSLSVCLGSADGNYLTRSAKRRKALSRKPRTVQKAVNFYSPANQTTIIEDLDRQIEMSVKKNEENNAEKVKRNQNVTTRRKRSLSFDESMMSKSFNISRLPRPVSNQTSFLNATTTAMPLSSSSSSTSKTTRTKLPNFAAIHQRQFKKMENLIDHVKRKQERSHILINSANKVKPASAQKNISINMINKNTQNEKSKASKRIDMNSQTYKTITKTGTPKKIAPVQNKTADDRNTATTSKLPDPRNIKLFNNQKSANKPKPQLIPKKHLKPTQSFNVSSMANSSTLKPMFNLSTHIGANPTHVNPTSSSSSANTSALENKTLSTQDKMASRLQRHMDMFKGRAPAARAGVASRKNEAGIRGVRSNRRFELQMQHRRNLEN